MRAVALFLAGLMVGGSMTLLGFLAAGNWYEYHMHDRGDPTPLEMVNQRGWELLFVENTSGVTVWMYRRPRLRLH